MQFTRSPEETRAQVDRAFDEREASFMLTTNHGTPLTFIDCVGGTPSQDVSTRMQRRIETIIARQMPDVTLVSLVAARDLRTLVYGPGDRRGTTS